MKFRSVVRSKSGNRVIVMRSKTKKAPCEKVERSEIKSCRLCVCICVCMGNCRGNCRGNCNVIDRSEVHTEV